VKNIKKSFTEVVIDNIAWLHRYVNHKINNKDIAEDLVQEIFFKAFRAYPNYIEEGKLRAWLMKIAQNTIRNYFSAKKYDNVLSLDAEYDTDMPMYSYVASGNAPEDELIHKELMTEIIGVINRMPQKEKEVFTYRFINGYTVSETSAIMHIPEGSVKSKTYYAIKRIRQELGVVSDTGPGVYQAKIKRRYVIMTCKDAYKYLFMYAKGTLETERRETLKEHLAACKDCAGITAALERLIPHMTYAQDDEMTHFLIDFPMFKLSYSGAGFHVDNAEQLNEVLKKNDGYIPKGENWFSNGFSNCNHLLAEFDNEGHELEIEIVPNGDSHYRANVVRMKQIYEPVMWLYDTFIYDNVSGHAVKKALEDPRLYYGRMHNMLGNEGYAKSALYAAIPGNAENIRIKRGNGFIDCGRYKFA